MPKVKVGDVPFKEAIAFIKNKVKIPTENWDDMLGDIHAKAFTVAGATNMDVLSDIHNAVKSALENGTTITDFRKEFDKTVQKHGWSYKGKRGWRTRIIYDTNLRTAHMAGKWEQFQRVKSTRPYLQYLTVGDSRVRPQHGSWHNKTLTVDDPWWDTHYPPNGWGCRCSVRSLSESQLKKSGFVGPFPKDGSPSDIINTRTGEIYKNVPDGIDVGWDYNVGKAWLGPDIAFGKKAMDLPGVIRKSVLSDSTQFAEIIEKPFTKWAKDAFASEYDRGELHAVGFLSDNVIKFFQSKKINISTATISISDDRLRRMRRDHKQGKKKGTRNEGVDITIPQIDLEKLPSKLAFPNAVVWEIKKETLLYIFSSSKDDKKAKIIVSIEFNIKGVVTNRVVSGSIANIQALNNKDQFVVIEGKL